MSHNCPSISVHVPAQFLWIVHLFLKEYLPTIDEICWFYILRGNSVWTLKRYVIWIHTLQSELKLLSLPGKDLGGFGKKSQSRWLPSWWKFWDCCVWLFEPCWAPEVWDWTCHGLCVRSHRERVRTCPSQPQEFHRHRCDIYTDETSPALSKTFPCIQHVLPQLSGVRAWRGSLSSCWHMSHSLLSTRAWNGLFAMNFSRTRTQEAWGVWNNTTVLQQTLKQCHFCPHRDRGQARHDFSERCLGALHRQDYRTLLEIHPFYTAS